MEATGAGDGRRRLLELRPLLVLTSVLVFLTVVMGVATRAAGAGLACNANWPLCDGGLLNLFPATLPSFFEWLHRLVAGVTGIAIIGSAVVAWRRSAHASIRWGTAVAAVVLPIQVLLGRETVVSFVPPVLAAHYWAAMVIYAAIVVATAVAWRDHVGSRLARRGLALALLAVPAILLLSPPIVTTYTPAVQATQYVAILLAFAALLVALVDGWEAPDRTRRTRLVATALLPAMVFFGRQRIVDPELPFAVAHEVTALALFLALLAAIGIDRRSRDGDAPIVGER